MKRIIPLILGILLIFCSCTPKTQSGKKLKIVTTIYPLYDFVRAIGKDRADIELLVKPGTEIHSFDPKPSDMVSIKNADLFLYIGGESENWVKRVLNDTDAVTFSLIETVDEKKAEENHDHHHDEHFDEHIWTNPENAIVMIEQILQKMSVLDKNNAYFYEINAKNYSNEIKKVSDEIRKTVEKAPQKHIVVADRFPFKYLTEEYGLNYTAAFGGCAVSTDISINVMNNILNVIKEKNIKYVYYVEMSNKNIANAVKQETNVELIELHSAHNVTLDDFNAGKTYLDIIKSNQKALERGLTL